MKRWLIERRLSDVSVRLRNARVELEVVGHQLGALNDDADDARLRSLVAESPLADHEFRHNQRHADAMASSQVELIARIAELERTQDELLDKLSSGPR